MKLKEGFVSRKIGNATVVVPVTGGSDGKMFRLNSTAGEILDMLIKGLSAEEIACELAREYEVDLDSAKKDTAAAIENMIASGFVEE